MLDSHIRPWAVAIVLGGIVVGSAAWAEAEEKDDGPQTTDQQAQEAPVVQLALLLDTSNSMDGLIDQAKTQLWKIVNEFATAKRHGVRPDLYVALYEYGNSGLPAQEGHVRQCTRGQAQ